MPDPADLPMELLGPILDMALERDTQHLCDLALVNRKWYILMLDRIYRDWAYNGARQSFMRLWKFVRTVRSNAHIAARVRTLNIGNWGFYPRRVRQPQRKLQLLPDEIELIHKAIHDAGLSDLEESIVESLFRRDRRPLMVMLLASVPNLSTLYAHVPQSDPILGTFLKRKFEFRTSGKPLSSLSKLKELYLFNEIPALETVLDDHDASSCLRLDYLWPVFYLPSLRTLSLFCLNPRKAAEYLGHHAAVSHVENLYLIADSESVFTQPDTQALLTQTERLKSLSLNLPRKGRLHSVSISDIWDYLQKYKGSLQTIDIHQADATHGGKNEHFGPFHELPSLMSLSGHAQTLLGSGALFRLQEALPPTIQSLTIYDSSCYCMGCGAFPDLPEQVQELLEGQFPSLKSITLEVNERAYDDDIPMERYQHLREVCVGKGVILRLENGDQLSKGGSCKELWAKTFYMRKDGNQRLDAVSWRQRELRDSEETLLKSAEELADDDGDITDSDDGYNPRIHGKTRSIITHTIPFLDHRSKTSYMVFENMPRCPLPPLFSFAIYFTHPSATPDLVGLFDQVSEDSGGDADFAGVRFDIYFLPSATHEDCISHYSTEKATRGSYLEQVRVLNQCPRDEVHPLAGTSPVVPGMVNMYDRAYQVLYICSEKDWREGQQTLCKLHFTELASADTTPAFGATDRPMTTHSPAYTEMGAYPVSQQMWFGMAHRDSDLFLGPWQTATNRGWTGW